MECASAGDHDLRTAAAGGDGNVDVSGRLDGRLAAHLRRHPLALLGASAARFGAPSAVLGFVLVALHGAGLANPGAQPAELGREATAARH